MLFVDIIIFEEFLTVFKKGLKSFKDGVLDSTEAIYFRKAQIIESSDSSWNFVLSLWIVQTALSLEIFFWTALKITV